MQNTVFNRNTKNIWVKVVSLWVKGCVYGLVGAGIVFLTACGRPTTSTPNVTTFTPTLFQTATQNPIMPNLTETPAPTVKSLPILELKSYEPKIISLCPEQQEVSFKELDIDPNFRLLLDPIDDDDQAQVFSISVSDLIPSEVPNTQDKEGWTLFASNPSPSGAWIHLIYVNEDETKNSVCLSSPDGQKQWQVTTLDSSQRETMVSDEELIIIDAPPELQYEGTKNWWNYMPMITLNTFTGETRNLALLPLTNSVYDFYFTLNGVSYSVYHLLDGPEGTYFLFNYSDLTSTPIFQWLFGGDENHLLFPGVDRRKNDLFVTIIDRSYGFDLAIDLSFNDLFRHASYNETMKKIIMPGGDDIDIRTLTYYWVTRSAFPIFRTEVDSDAPAPLYMFDYQQMLLKDYCLPVLFSGRMFISPDDRFLSVTVGRIDDDQGNPKEVIVIDTITGHYAVINGYTSNGWIIMNSGSTP